jgi:hypothetical protein
MTQSMTSTNGNGDDPKARLLARGLARIKATGRTPRQVAADMFLHKAVPAAVRRELELVGLAALLADELAKDRARVAREAEEAEWEARRQQRQAAEAAARERVRAYKEARAAYRARFPDRAAYQAAWKRDVAAFHRRLWGEAGCGRAGCGRGDDGAMLGCIGGNGLDARMEGHRVVLAPRAEQERFIAAHRREQAAKEARRQEAAAARERVEDIHDRTGCRNRMYAASHGHRAECVRKWVTCHPEDQWEARIAECRRYNDDKQRRHDDMVDRVVRACERSGYERAVEDLRGILLLAADGTMKPLLNFDAADLAKWERTSASQEAAWAARHDWFTAAAAALEAEGVGSLADLPAARLMELGERARAVWKKEDPSGGDAARQATTTAAEGVA